MIFLLSRTSSQFLCSTQSPIERIRDFEPPCEKLPGPKIDLSRPFSAETEGNWSHVTISPQLQNY